MKLPKQQQREIIQGLLPLLAVAYENTEAIVKIEGRSLIYEGITKDMNGRQIHPGTEYVVRRQVQTKINHVRRIKNVIDRSTTLENMQEDLARYLAKYGTSKQDITDSIGDAVPPRKN